MMSPVGLQPVLTPALLHSLRTHPQLPKHVWYYVAGVTLSALNRPDEVPALLTYALENGADACAPAAKGVSESSQRADQLYVARRMREGLLKSAAIVGVPKVINAILALKKVTPEYLLDHSDTPSPSGRATEIYGTPTATVLARGQTFFERLYGKISRRVMGQMDRSGTEDLGLTARLMYGYILSNEKVLDAKETSFVAIAGLIPQDVNPQLKGHLRGALNHGATADEIRAVREIVISICEAAGMRTLGGDAVGGWGWREQIADV
ncbi:carboxymuconolactone decarboxylase [Diplodia corticola]|uniref:Carboxymuconolactone decarboxylase n=1 Tax=Diplodia corticola TaxID=236234 RepID=A0A1J9S7Y6_9PEZI|nr:carboxymuconolactone decarboxylase [Diplodia corticola]OJD35693.1 carboxymuconolactone decarboxylase [Diplodia corticola]